MVKFDTTVEFLPGQPGAAIVALFDQAGEWSGAERVQIRSSSRDDLYEACYIHASRKASDKGGRVETFRTVTG